METIKSFILPWCHIELKQISRTESEEYKIIQNYLFEPNTFKLRSVNQREMRSNVRAEASI